MTQIACKIKKKSAFILTDTRVEVVGPGFRQIGFEYKPVIVPGAGVIILSRGTADVCKNIKESAENQKLKNIDDFVSCLPEMLEEERIKNLLRFCGGKLPEDYNSMDDYEAYLLEIAKDKSAEIKTRVLISCLANLEVYCVGFSKKHQHMGFVCKASYIKGPLVLQKYTDMIFFKEFQGVQTYWNLVHNEPIHNASTPEQLAEAFRVSHKLEVEFLKKSAGIPAEVLDLAGGGDINLTTLKADGSFKVQNLGPLVQ